MFKTRLLSSIVLVIIMLTGLLYGGPVITVLMLFISLVGMMELYRVFGIHREILGIAGYLLAIVYFVLVHFQSTEMPELLMVIALIIFMGIYVFTFPKYTSVQVMCGYFSFVYVAVMLSYICRIRMWENGIYLVWLVFICSWINDTCAYLVGITIGKHKMTPKLSPKKSIEGAVGGVIGSGIVGFLYALWLKNILGISNMLIAFPVACCVGAMFSIVGDLAASAIKRNYEVKDFGKLIPGHGGILDRFDSVIFTAPIVYWVINLFTR